MEQQQAAGPIGPEGDRPGSMSAPARDPSSWAEREVVRRVAGHTVRVALPSKSDPRLIEILALTIVTVLRVTLVHQPLTAAQILAAVGTSVVLDIAGNYLRRKVVVAPVSALITGLIICLILLTPQTWPFAAAAAIAIGSKHVIRVKGRQLFNPAVLGLTTVLVAFPHAALAGVDRWELSAATSPILTLGGDIAVSRAKMLDVVKGFVPLYVVLLTITTVVQNGLVASRLQATFFLASHAFVIVAFYLLSDPRTAPPSRTGRIVYAMFAAVVGSLLILPGLDRTLALMIAVLAANVAGAFVIGPRFAHEIPLADLPAKTRLPLPLQALMFATRVLRPAKVGQTALAAAPSADGRPALDVVESSEKPDRQHPVSRHGSTPVAAPPIAGVPADQTLLMPSASVRSLPYLVIGGERHPLSPGETTLGRAPANAFRLEEPGVSRHHAVFTFWRGKVFLTDLYSRNGTFVNGSSITAPVELQDGDRIDFGGTELGGSATFKLASVDALAEDLPNRG